MNIKNCIILNKGKLKVILLTGRIEKNTDEIFKQALRYFIDKKEPGVDVFINTPGGYYEACRKISTLIEDSVDKIWIRGISQLAYSGGNFIFQACHWREILPLGKIFIHRMSNESGQILSSRDVKAERSMLNIFSKRTGKTIDEIYDIANKETCISAVEALKEKWVDKIIDSKDPFFQYLNELKKSAAIKTHSLKI